VQLGTSTHVPVAMAVGDYHVVVSMKNSSNMLLKSWGLNGFGQLGHGDPNWEGQDPEDRRDHLPAINFGNFHPASLCNPGLLIYSFFCALCDECTWALAAATTRTDCIPCHGGYSSTKGNTHCTA